MLAPVRLSCLFILFALTGSLLPGRVFAAPKARRVKNVIFMICDGCGPNQIEAASYYRFGVPSGQSYRAFPTSLSVSTYSLGGSYNPAAASSDFSYFTRTATDSAAAATALSTGIKTINGAIGVDSKGASIEHLFERAEQLGRSTGVVTSGMFSHATPTGPATSTRPVG